MRKILVLSCVLALGHGLSAGEQIVSVSPQALGNWTVIGADRATLAQASSLALPAGAQLARSFPVSSVSVKLVTQPVFASGAANWPVLELGSAALIFQRSGDEGKLAIALDEAAPVVLPFVIKLDTDGRCAAPLVLNFTRRGPAVKVEVSGETLPWQGSSAPAPALEVIVSAGADQAWSLESMTVIFATPDVAPSPMGTSGSTSASSGPNAAPTETDPALKGMLPAALADSASNPASSGPIAGSSVNSGSVHGLEIFTPPSVRHGRADAIRTAVAKKVQP